LLAAGEAEGEVLALAEPLSFWGGLDVETGAVIDRRHPQLGAVVTGRVLLMPSGRGSSSSSSVLAEAVRRGTGPAAVLLGEPDPIVALGALVAAELYGRRLPVGVLDEAGYTAVALAGRVRITREGEVHRGSG
jgi:predicted aconitase with swiveling domain